MYRNDADPEYAPIVDILIEILGKYRMHSSDKGQISFDCPVCSYDIKSLDHGDGKGNLEVNYKDEVFKCWSCAESHETHGSLYRLIKKFGTLKQLKRYEILKPDDVRVIEATKKEIKMPQEFIPLNNVSDGFKMTHYYKQAKNYLNKRNVDDKIIRKYNIGFCYEGPYANRIIIPSYDQERELNYFIARSYLERTKMKYKNPEVEKETIIWNECLVDWSKRIYLVEGAFDSIFLPNSIAMLGKYISDKLFNKIYENGNEVTIVLDGDAWNDTEKLFHKMNCGKLFGKIYVIKLPKDKDIADLQGKLDEYKEYKIE
jgi:DNA primase